MKYKLIPAHAIVEDSPRFVVKPRSALTVGEPMRWIACAVRPSGENEAICRDRAAILEGGGDSAVFHRDWSPDILKEDTGEVFAVVDTHDPWHRARAGQVATPAPKCSPSDLVFSLIPPSPPTDFRWFKPAPLFGGFQRAKSNDRVDEATRGLTIKVTAVAPTKPTGPTDAEIVAAYEKWRQGDERTWRMPPDAVWFKVGDTHITRARWSEAWSRLLAAKVAAAREKERRRVSVQIDDPSAEDV